MGCDNRVIALHSLPNKCGCGGSEPGPTGPRGEPGDPGPQGPAGPAGPAFPGIPGGTTGQALIKLSNADYDYGWANITITPDPDPDPDPDPGTEIIPEPVPGQDQFWDYMEEWASFIHTYLNNEPNGDFKLRAAGYYDAEACRYVLADHFNDTATYFPMADRANDWYADYYLRPNNGQLVVYYIQPWGLAENVLRGRPNAVQSMSDLLLLFNAAYVSNNSSGETPLMSTTPYSRETAFGLGVHIHAARAGHVLTTQQLTRRAFHFENTLSIMTKWKDNTGFACHPFMVGISCKALTDYIMYVADDPRVLPLMADVANYVWDNCWVPDAQAFTYADRATGNPDDLQPQPTLNQFVSPIFGWLWKETGNPIWRERGDQIWLGGLPNYSGNFWVSGTDLGTRSASNPAGKQYNEQLYWGYRYPEWGEATVIIP